MSSFQTHGPKSGSVKGPKNRDMYMINNLMGSLLSSMKTDIKVIPKQNQSPIIKPGELSPTPTNTQVNPYMSEFEKNYKFRSTLITNQKQVAKNNININNNPGNSSILAHFPKRKESVNLRQKKTSADHFVHSMVVKNKSHGKPNNAQISPKGSPAKMRVVCNENGKFVTKSLSSMLRNPGALKISSRLTTQRDSKINRNNVQKSGYPSSNTINTRKSSPPKSTNGSFSSKSTGPVNNNTRNTSGAIAKHRSSHSKYVEKGPSLYKNPKEFDDKYKNSMIRPKISEFNSHKSVSFQSDKRPNPTQYYIVKKRPRKVVVPLRENNLKQKPVINRPYIQNQNKSVGKKNISNNQNNLKVSHNVKMPVNQNTNKYITKAHVNTYARTPFNTPTDDVQRSSSRKSFLNKPLAEHSDIQRSSSRGSFSGKPLSGQSDVKSVSRQSSTCQAIKPESNQGIDRIMRIVQESKSHIKQYFEKKEMLVKEIKKAQNNSNKLKQKGKTEMNRSRSNLSKPRHSTQILSPTNNRSTYRHDFVRQQSPNVSRSTPASRQRTFRKFNSIKMAQSKIQQKNSSQRVINNEQDFRSVNPIKGRPFSPNSFNGKNRVKPNSTPYLKNNDGGKENQQQNVPNSTPHLDNKKSDSPLNLTTQKNENISNSRKQSKDRIKANESEVTMVTRKSEIKQQSKSDLVKKNSQIRSRSLSRKSKDRIKTNESKVAVVPRKSEIKQQSKSNLVRKKSQVRSRSLSSKSKDRIKANESKVTMVPRKSEIKQQSKSNLVRKNSQVRSRSLSSKSKDRIKTNESKVAMVPRKSEIKQQSKSDLVRKNSQIRSRSLSPKYSKKKVITNQSLTKPPLNNSQKKPTGSIQNTNKKENVSTGPQESNKEALENKTNLQSKTEAIETKPKLDREQKLAIGEVLVNVYSTIRENNLNVISRPSMKLINDKLQEIITTIKKDTDAKILTNKNVPTQNNSVKSTNPITPNNTNTGNNNNQGNNNNNLASSKPSPNNALENNKNLTPPKTSAPNNCNNNGNNSPENNNNSIISKLANNSPVSNNTTQSKPSTPPNLPENNKVMQSKPSTPNDNIKGNNNNVIQVKPSTPNNSPDKHYKLMKSKPTTPNNNIRNETSTQSSSPDKKDNVIPSNPTTRNNNNTGNNNIAKPSTPENNNTISSKPTTPTNNNRGNNNNINVSKHSTPENINTSSKPSTPTNNNRGNNNNVIISKPSTPENNNTSSKPSTPTNNNRGNNNNVITAKPSTPENNNTSSKPSTPTNNNRGNNNNNVIISKPSTPENNKTISSKPSTPNNNNRGNNNNVIISKPSTPENNKTISSKPSTPNNNNNNNRGNNNNVITAKPSTPENNNNNVILGKPIIQNNNNVIAMKPTTPVKIPENKPSPNNNNNRANNNKVIFSKPSSPNNTTTQHKHSTSVNNNIVNINNLTQSKSCPPNPIANKNSNVRSTKSYTPTQPPANINSSKGNNNINNNNKGNNNNKSNYYVVSPAKPLTVYKGNMNKSNINIKNSIEQNKNINYNSNKKSEINMLKITTKLPSKPPSVHKLTSRSTIFKTGSNAALPYFVTSNNAMLTAPFSHRKLLTLTPMEIVQDYVNLVNKAKKERKTFTVCGNYYSVRRAFEERGWVEKMRINVIDDKESLRRLETLSNFELVEGIKDREHGEKYKKIFISKLLAGHQVDFYWDYMTNPFSVNNDKIKRTIINRFPYGSTRSYTSKAGLCESLKEASWYYIEGYSNIQFPRTYNLAMEDELDSFIQDFRRTSVISLLLWIIRHSDKPQSIISPTGQIPTSIFNFATLQCYNYIKIKEHKDLEQIIPVAREYEWDIYLEKFYKVVHQGQHFKETEHINAALIIDQTKYILDKLRKYDPNIDYDGHMNLWLLKPSNGSRGCGIHVCRTLKYALDTIDFRKETKYVVQKYIERPLLIHSTKFDIRQWFLVTCMPNLHVWLYKDCYLRFSSQLFDLSKLHESIHLTNNSVQCRYKNNLQRNTSLPEQNMWHSDTFRKYLSDIGQPYAWRNIIYKGIKECLVGLFMLCQDKLQTRVNSFELCGADFMLREDYRPFLIEINSRPALYPSTRITAKMCPKVLEDVIRVTVDYARNPRCSTGSFELIYTDDYNYIPPKNVNSLFIQGISYVKYASKAPPKVTCGNPIEHVALNELTEDAGNSIKKVLKIDANKVRKDVKNTLEKILAIIHSEQNKPSDKQSDEKNKQFRIMLSEFVDIISCVKNKNA